MGIRERSESPRPETTAGPLQEIGGKQQGTPEFLETPIVAMGTTVSTTPNLEALETAGTTRPKNWSSHLSHPLQLANSPLTPGNGGAIPEGLHDQNHTVHLDNFSLFFQVHAPRRG
jgi:hypothetical protein